MVSKCANPACSADFRYLRSGKLFEFEVGGENGNTQVPTFDGNKSSRRIEYFWLCGDCALQMTLVVSKHGGVISVPIAKPTLKVAAAS